MRYRVVTLALLGALGVAPSARAEPLQRGALRLEWSAPGGCPNGVEVVERIEALLGARVAELAPEPLAARGTVRELEALRFELALETQQREQRFVRSMQAPSCAELSDAGALVLALAIDPTLAERQARAAGTGPETSALPAETPPPPVAEAPAVEAKPAVQTLDMADPRDEPPPPPPPLPRTEVEWAVRLGLVLDFGSVADSSFGPRASVELGLGALRFELGALWLPPAESYVGTDDSRGGAVDLVAGQAAACILPLRGAVDLGACGGVELGRLHGQGFGTTTEAEGSTLWFGAGLGALVRGRATEALTVVLSAGAIFVPQDTVFTLENVGTVHRVPPLVARLGLGIETEFP